MQAFSQHIKTQGDTICLVPTMGFFHAGHLALMKRAAEVADHVLVSLFVNPTQFAPGEDLDAYPRDFAADCAKAEALGVEGLFCPDVEEMYPAPCQTTITIASLSGQLCGQSRPSHFAGVATVVTKLFNICQPDYAIFGEKDFQQLAVIRQMVHDLDQPVKVLSVPIIREADGLAMSSRNIYLTTGERVQALCLSQGLQVARASAAKGRTCAEIVKQVEDLVSKQPSAEIDYIKIVNKQTLDESVQVDRHALLAMAVKIGKTRLLDNGFLL